MYQELSGCSSSIPLEQDIATSNCAHWSEKCFSDELMSSVANDELPISSLTIAALEDLGYQVDYYQVKSMILPISTQLAHATGKFVATCK